MRISCLILLLAGLSLLAACEDEFVLEEPTDFDAFVLEVADALALGDLERLVHTTARVMVECDERLVQETGPCQALPIGSSAEGYSVKVLGKEPSLLDGEAIRLLLEGMLFGADLQVSPDEFGGPALQVHSTLFPDPVLWFARDEEQLPVRGDIAITYVGRSPSEDDQVKRRLWTAVAEQDEDGIWKIRLWLVGFFRTDHPALNPTEENGFKRWSPPGAGALPTYALLWAPRDAEFADKLPTKPQTSGATGRSVLERSSHI